MLAQLQWASGWNYPPNCVRLGCWSLYVACSAKYFEKGEGILFSSEFGASMKKHYTRLSDREGHGHKAVVYKSHFPPLRHSVVTETPADTLANKPCLLQRPSTLSFIAP